MSNVQKAAIKPVSQNMMKNIKYVLCVHKKQHKIHQINNVGCFEATV